MSPDMAPERRTHVVCAQHRDMPVLLGRRPARIARKAQRSLHPFHVVTWQCHKLRMERNTTEGPCTSPSPFSSLPFKESHKGNNKFLKKICTYVKLQAVQTVT